MKIKLKDLALLIQGQIVGDENHEVNSVGKIESAQENEISFLANPKYESYIYATQAGAVLVNKSFEPKKPIQTNLIKVEDPYSAFTVLLEEYNRLKVLMKKGIEQPSFMATTATVGEAPYLGAFSYIGEGSKLGNNVKIYPNAYIGSNVTIGDNTIIHPGVRVLDDTIIGSHCTIHANTVIGTDGFGFAPQKDGSYKPIPQIGRVVIEDHVRIGANCVIDRATMGETAIRFGSKIDNLIQIAHNVEIGKHTVIAAQAGLSGSSKVGDYCMIGGQVGLAGHIQVPDNTKIAAQSGIMSGPKEEGSTIIGSPAFEIKDYLKSYAIFKNLPELAKRIKELEEKMLNLTAL